MALSVAGVVGEQIRAAQGPGAEEGEYLDAQRHCLTTEGGALKLEIEKAILAPPILLHWIFLKLEED